MSKYTTVDTDYELLFFINGKESSVSRDIEKERVMTMRGTDRIEPFLKEIGEVWEKNVPDWRFGQLMYNFMSWLANEKHRDVFFPEEEEFLESFKEYLNRK